MIGNRNEESRHQWVREQLNGLKKDLRILDAGAGEKRYQDSCRHLQYVSQDFAQYDGQGNGQGLQTSTWDQSNLDIISDIVSIPEPDASFDVLLCTEVLEHIPDPLAALQEFSRLLKPSGVLLLTAPFASATHFAPYFFTSGFSRFFYEKHLPRMGFTLENLISNGDFYEGLAQELHRLQPMAEKNNIPLNFLDRKALQRTLTLLQRMQSQSEDSSSFSCHGLFIRARRNGISKR